MHWAGARVEDSLFQPEAHMPKQERFVLLRLAIFSRPEEVEHRYPSQVNGSGR